VMDIFTDQRRYSNKNDITQFTTIADALPQVGIQWQCCSANDKPVLVRPMHETHAQWHATSKHIMQMTAIDPFNARGLVEMCRVIAGGEAELRERPIMSNFQCSISPLHWDEPTVEAMQVFAEAGIPVGMCAMPLAGASDWYLLAQLTKFKDGWRGTDPTDVWGMTMRAQAMMLPDTTAMKNVIAYIQTLR